MSEDSYGNAESARDMKEGLMALFHHPHCHFFVWKKRLPSPLLALILPAPCLSSVAVTSKRSGYVCTHAVLRAVHLDLVTDPTIPSFLQSLKCFIARCGIPARILSDNGRTFKDAAQVITAIVTNFEVQKYLTGLGVKWMSNVPKVPWWGGVFEGMIQSIKCCLQKIIGMARFLYDELLTALTEVELIINSRPISYVSEDDLEEHPIC